MQEIDEEVLYDRQQNFELNIPESVTIVGCGGVGYWIGLFLAISGVEKFLLYDIDVIDLSNLNRIPVPVDKIGLFKSNVLRDHILNLRPDADVLSLQRFTHISPVNGVLIDCTDVVKTQEMIKERASKELLKYIRIGCSENHITVHSDTTPDEWSDLEQSGYDRVPSWIGASVLSAILGVCKILKSKSEDLYIFIDDIFDIKYNTITINEFADKLPKKEKSNDS